MKALGYTMAAIGVVTIGVAGYFGYCIMSKETKQRADRLLSSVCDDVKHKKINMNMTNK